MTALKLLNSNDEATATATTLNVRPMCEKALVRVLKSDYHGVILRPETFEETFIKAEVLAVGPGRLKLDSKGADDRIPLYIKVGQQIVFSRKAAVQIDPYDKDILLVSEDVVQCILGDD